MPRRLAITPTQLRTLLEVLTPFGFSAARVELTPAGGVILHSDVTPTPSEIDALTAWELGRARRP